MTTVTRFPEPDSIRSRVAAEVRSWMGRRNVNQTQLAAALNISQSQMSKRLRGVIALDIDELEKIAAFLDVNIAAFFGGSPATSGPDGGGAMSDARPVTKRLFDALAA